MTNIELSKKSTLNKSNIIKFLMIFVGFSGCFSVLFGAWLAHAGQLYTVDVQSSLKTALQYQLFHTLALFVALVWAIMNLADNKLSKILLAACISFLLGIVLFSGGIYIKTFFSFSIVGKLTPFGGISLAVAWLLLAFEGKNNL